MTSVLGKPPRTYRYRRKCLVVYMLFLERNNSERQVHCKERRTGLLKEP